jgi:hypothetical protein
MTRKTMLALIAQADLTLADNITGDISAADVRSMVKDIIDSFAPGYGAASTASVVLPALGLPPQAVTYTTTLALTPEYTINLLTGEITRLAQGLPTTVNRVSFYADVAAPAGNEVVFSLQRNGITIPGGTTVSGQGVGNFSQASFSVGTTSPDGANYAYRVVATKISGGADNVTLADVRFILESVPTLGI